MARLVRPRNFLNLWVYRVHLFLEIWIRSGTPFLMILPECQRLKSREENHVETRRHAPRVETAKRESASIRSYSRDFIADKILATAATTSDWRATDILRGRLRDKPRSNAGIERRVQQQPPVVSLSKVVQGRSRDARTLGYRNPCNKLVSPRSLPP